MPFTTLTGTEQADHLVGGHERDIARGLGGDDFLGTDGGRDQLYGGTGNDLERGGGGADVVYGGDGDDVLVGGTGNDALRGDDPFGAAGNDYIDAGPGDDHVEAGFGHDTVRLGPGADSLAVTVTDHENGTGVEGIGKTDLIDFGDGDSLTATLEGPDRVQHHLAELDTNGDGRIDFGDADTFVAKHGDLAIDFGHAFDRLAGTSGHEGEVLVLHGVHAIGDDGHLLVG